MFVCANLLCYRQANLVPLQFILHHSCFIIIIANIFVCYYVNPVCMFVCIFATN